MASIVLVETSGSLKTLKTKEISFETLYKKCGFRISDDFKKQHTWEIKLKEGERYVVSLWAKKTGKANFENKYDFPPPVDNALYFGTCAIVRTALESEETILNLTKEEWTKIYEKLFGGFHDLGGGSDSDEYSEDELENVDPALLTADGYLKDDFIVSDTSAVVSAAHSPNPSPPPSVLPKKQGKTKGEKVAKGEKVSKSEKKNSEIIVEVSTDETIMNGSKEKKSLKTRVQKKEVQKKEVQKKEVQKKEVQKKEESDDEEMNENESTSELEEEVYTFSDED